MLIQRQEAEMLTLFIISSLPDEVTMSEAREILLAGQELDRMEIDGYLQGLAQRGQIYIKHGSGPLKNEKYVGITETGKSVVAALSERKLPFRACINRALRHYKKIVCGIDYRIELVKVAGGSNVEFQMLLSGKTYFSTTLFFSKSMDALKVYNRLDDDPEGFYNGVMTVATGDVGYMK